MSLPDKSFISFGKTGGSTRKNTKKIISEITESLKSSNVFDLIDNIDDSYERVSIFEENNDKRVSIFEEDIVQRVSLFA